MKFLKSLTLVICLFSFTATYADHIVGYDMCLINIKNPNGTPTDKYKWRLKIFRDVLGIPIPTQAIFNIYRQNDNSTVGSFTCTKINPTTIIQYPPEDCPPAQAQLRILYCK